MRFLTILFFTLLAPAYYAAAQTSGYTLDDDLIYRINFGSAQDVKLLLDKGANPNAVTKQGETALDVAIDRNDAEAVDMAVALIKKGSDPNAVDKAGNAPVINALRYKQTKVVKALIDSGADYHIRSTDGSSLVDFATKSNDPESARLIGDLLAKEEAYASSLRSPDRFKGIVRHYVMDSCIYQYWSYFLASRQSPSKDEETNTKIAKTKSAINQSILQFQKYYPTASTESLRKASSAAVNQIFEQLDSMISNRNREEYGIGSDKDAEERCEKIVQNLNIDFVPAGLSAQPQSRDKTAKPALLPIEPLTTPSSSYGR